MRHASDTVVERKGMSLAKGPVAITGLALIAFGVISMIFGATSFLTDAPAGQVDGTTWLGIEANGWTALLSIICGAVLLFGASAHWGAKTTALIVAAVLGAFAVMWRIDGNDVLGVFAANSWTALAALVATALLLVSALLPRVGRRESTSGEMAQSRVASATPSPGTADDSRDASTDSEADGQARTAPSPAATSRFLRRHSERGGDGGGGGGGRGRAGSDQEEVTWRSL